MQLPLDNGNVCSVCTMPWPASRVAHAARNLNQRSQGSADKQNLLGFHKISDSLLKYFSYRKVFNTTHRLKSNIKQKIWYDVCRPADSVAELEQLRIQFDNSEAARRELEKRVKDSGIIKQRLLMACTVG